jgi:hypothetical protein
VGKAVSRGDVLVLLGRKEGGCIRWRLPVQAERSRVVVVVLGRVVSGVRVWWRWWRCCRGMPVMWLMTLKTR